MIERAGAFSIVLECITKKLATRITNSIKIPTIGIGSSSSCDGQILVTDALMGLSGFYPRFVKKYTNLEKVIESCFFARIPVKIAHSSATSMRLFAELGLKIFEISLKICICYA